MSDSKTTYALWRAGAWSGLFYILGGTISFALIAGFLPPPRQGWSTPELVQYFAVHNLAIRIGMVGYLFTGGFYLPWSSTMSKVITRIEGPQGMLANLELMGGVLTVVVICVSGVDWMAISFRMASRTPGEIQLLYDLGWLFFNMTFIATFMQMFAVGIAILIDRRPVPLFPKWLAWFGFAAALTFLPLFFMPFVMDGPFAWDGLVNFWIALSAFIWWVVILAFYLFGAIGKLELEG